MLKLSIALVIAGMAAVPAAAQSDVSAQAAPAKAKYVEKVVCQKIEEERSTGSRLGRRGAGGAHHLPDDPGGAGAEITGLAVPYGGGVVHGAERQRTQAVFATALRQEDTVYLPVTGRKGGPLTLRRVCASEPPRRAQRGGRL